MQPADLLVEIDQAGGQARQAAVPGMGFGGHGHGAVQGVGEGHETLADRAGLGQGVELLLGGLDLVAGRGFAVGGLGAGGDLLADADQIPAQRQVIDGPGIVRGMGRGRRPVHQIGQVAQAPQLLERRIAGELLGDQDRLGQLPLADRGLDGAVEAAMEGLEEVPCLQVVPQALEDGVVVEQRPQQGLLGLDIGRGVIVVGFVVLRHAQIKGGNNGHGLLIA